MKNEITDKIDLDWQKALKSKFPSDNLLIEKVYLKKLKYSQGILDAFHYLLENHKDFFVIGQGLWSRGM